MSVIIDDRQMECLRGPEKNSCIFLTAQTNERDELVFIAKRVIWNEATDENDELGTETFKADEFSAWWKKRRKAGWRFCG